MTETSEAATRTTEEELAARVASVIRDFCEDLPGEDCERIGAYAARTAWACGSATQVQAERDAQARIDEIRAVLDEDAATRARFQVDVSTSYGPRFLSRIRAIVEREAPRV